MQTPSPQKSSRQEEARGAARAFARPRVVMSRCLELDPVRHDGQKIPDPFVRRLLERVDVVPICPEVEIGLGVPRDTIRMVDVDGRTRLVQPSTGLDLTGRMDRFTQRFLDAVGPIDGFVLKAGSPSCGSGQVKVYAGIERAPTVRKESGRFAAQVIARYGNLAVEDEGRLRNYPIRDHFLLRLYAFARLRELLHEPSIAALVDFQRRYKHILMTYQQEAMRELGRIVANQDRLPAAEVVRRYSTRFREALARRPSRGAQINTLSHLYSHFRARLPDAERAEFLQILDEVRDHHLAVITATTIIRTWVARYGYDDLADQAYLEPYPRDLVLMRDSGKGLEF